MADTTIKLKVLLESAGIKPTQKQLENLNKKLQGTATGMGKVSNAANKTKRNLEGVAQRSGSTGKDFSRMSQGMGGLVQAYATVAANVFALSSAFLVLRRTADLSSMMKSAEDFSNRFGVSVTRITKNLQQATGGALSFAEALPIVNKAVSAGIPIEKMEQLAVAATKAAQTFGGSATEALNRFISASQRGRVEIIQTLGIIIKTEQAYKDYAAEVGKTALELTAFDRQQAILNATIEESQNIFDQVNIDPNPFQQLLTTITDLKDTVGVFITDALTPMFNAFNQSKAAAAALIALIISSVAGRIFPAIGDQIAGLQAKSVASTTAATAALNAAKQKQAKVILDTEKNVSKLSKKQLLERDELFKSHYDRQLSRHKSFGKKLVDQTGKINAANLNEQRSALTKELNIRAGLTRGKPGEAFKGISTQALENQRNRLILLTKETERARAATDKLRIAENAKNDAFRRGIAIVGTATAKMRADLISFRSQITTGFSKSFATTQTNFILATKNMGRAWSIFVKRAIIESKGAQFAFEAFGRAVGRTAGLIAGGFVRALSVFSSLTLVISLGIFAWQKWGDTLRGISKQERAVIDASKEMEEALSEVFDRTAEGVVLLEQKGITSLKKLSDALLFTAGTFESISEAIRQMQIVTTKQLNNLTPGAAADRLREITEELNNIEEARVAALVAAGASKFSSVFLDPELKNRAEELTEELKNIEDVLVQIGKTNLRPLFNSFETGIELAAKTGFTDLRGALTDAFFDSGAIEQFKEIGGEASNSLLTLQRAFISGDAETFNNTVNKVVESLGEGSVEAGVFVTAVKNLVSTGSGVMTSLNRSLASTLKGLADVDNRLNNFILGLDKLKSVKSPNKELFGFILDVNNQLKDLIKNQNIASNTNLDDILSGSQISEGALENIKGLLGQEFDTVGKAQEEAQRLQDILAEGLEKQVLGAGKLKLIQVELAAIKNIEATSDEKAIQLIKDRIEIEGRLEKEKLDQLKITLNEAKIFRERITEQEGASNLQKDLAKQQVKVLEDQIQAQELKYNITLASLDAEREDLNIQKEKLNIQKNILSNATSINAINLKISVNNAQHLIFLKEEYRLNKASLENEKRQALLRVKETFILHKNGDASERQLRLAQSELDLIKAKTKELERQQLLIEAAQAEAAGVSVFDEEGLAISARFFVRKIRDEARNLKTTFQILGEGFVDVVNTGFDTIIDNLLEGGKDFGEVVRETLKASLREVIGEALKTQIKDAFSRLFTGETKEDQAEQDEATWRQESRTSMLDTSTKLQTQINLLTTIATNTAAAAGMGSGMPGLGGLGMPGLGGLSIPGLGKPKGGINPQTVGGAGAVMSQETMDKQLGEISKTLTKQFSLMQEPTVLDDMTTTELGKAPNIMSGLGIVGSIVSATQGDNKAAIIQALFAIAAQIIASQQAAAATNILGMGGIIKGGTSTPVPLANGGVLDRPTVALMGEGDRNEAVVPLPNNREIPVEMRGGGETININTEQHFDFSNANTDTIAQLQTEARMIEERTFNRVFSEINKGGRYAQIVGRR